MKKIKNILKTLLVIVILLSISYLFLPKYLVNALNNFYPKIYDYTIFENREVQNSVPQSWAISEKYNTDTIALKYEKYFLKMETVGFLIIQDDQIIHESYWDGSDKNKISGSFSAAKSIIAMLIGCAIDDGYIKSVDDQIGIYLDDFNHGENSVLTIKDLLTMSSGLNWDESYVSPFSITTQAYYGEDIWKLIKNMKVVEQAGYKYKYLSGNTQLLAFVLQKATGITISEYVSKKLWSKMGASSSALWSLDKKDGMEKAYCCFNTTLRDFARFGKLLLNNGNWEGEQLISENYMKRMQSPNTNIIDPKTNKMVDFYGYQLWILNYKNMKIPYMRGILGQYVFAIPSKKAIVVRLGGKRSLCNRNKHPLDVYKYIDIALEVLNKH